MEADAALRVRPGRELELGDRFIDALGYAARVHRSQLSAADRQPYVAHLLRVAGLVIQDGGSEDEAIAALLHDAVEDQGGIDRLEDIRGRYGPAVADIVEECSDSYGSPKPAWRARKEQYLQGLGSASRGALLVSLADKLDNVRTTLRSYELIGDTVWEGSGKSRDDVRWYYGALARRFSDLRPGVMSEELCRAVAELERLTAD